MTPIRTRFSVNTILRDRIAGIQNLNTPALVVTTALPNGSRYQVTNEYGWDSLYPLDTTVEHQWLRTLFGQELVPRTAVLIHWDKSSGTETIQEAMADAYTLGADWYFTAYEGIDDTAATLADQQAISAWVESHAIRRMAVLATQDIDAYSTASASDLAATQRALTMHRTVAIFHPASVTTISGVKDTSSERPDAAILGRLSATPEAKAQWSYNALSFVSDSALTVQQQLDLVSKGYCFVETFTNTVFTHLYKGLTVTDREIRIQWGVDWHDVNVESDIANYAFQTDLMAFDHETFTAVEGILRRWKDRALARRIIMETQASPARISLPDPDTLSAEVRASGVGCFYDVYDYALVTAITDWKLTGNWRIAL